MRSRAAIAAVATSLVTLAFAACKGGGDGRTEPDPPWPPPPAPTQTFPPERDCAPFGGSCQRNACEYGREACAPSAVMCQSTPRTEECGDLNAGPTYDGPRCCIPAPLDDVGWMKLTFDAECGLSFAHGGGEPAAPIEWEPCSPDLRSRWPECSFVRVDWPAGEGPYEGRRMDEAQAGSFDKQSSTARLVISRVMGPAIYRMIVRVDDGAVEAAFRETRPSCSLTHGDLRGQSFVFTVTRREGERIVKTGALRFPREYVPYPGETADGGEPIHFAGQRNLFTTPTNIITKYEWDGGGYAVSHEQVPALGVLENVVFRDDVLFFAGGAPQRPKIEIFASGQVRDFLGFGSDVPAAADFGTDGRDMVWTEASGRADAPGEPWSRIDIVTAPYTVLPELIGPTIHKRRLRSEISFDQAPFVVGCNYAAHAVGTSGVRLVRLTDGQSWMLSNEATDAGASWQVTSPLAVTCDELIVRLRRGDEHQVARLPFSTLGPGAAAD